MSGAGFMRLVKNVGDSIYKVAGKKSDADVVSILMLLLLLLLLLLLVLFVVVVVIVY